MPLKDNCHHLWYIPSNTETQRNSGAENGFKNVFCSIPYDSSGHAAVTSLITPSDFEFEIRLYG